MKPENLVLRIYDANFMPTAFREAKLEHYKSIFGTYFEEVYEKSLKLSPKEKTFILSLKDEPVARCVIEYNKYDLRIRDFTILKKFRGKGTGSHFMSLLEQEAMRHHSELIKKKEKYYLMMFLKTYIYPDGDSPGENFEMGKFLKKQAFKPYKHNPKTLSEEENKALTAYKKISPEYEKLLKTFKKKIISDITLRPEISEELQRLTEKEKETLLKGLKAKLDCYEKRGFISYKYSACPVCQDMKSSLENSSNCDNCYIKNTCLEPFKEGFKEDNEASYKYFSHVEWYINYLDDLQRGRKT
ncbi:GNAT family N-acetyltransferase [Candidatus Woesearchaeota archaeon]|nr:GNAT family N-acetyltransferase [Candidatus Woesearchaeota archaeon]